MCRRGESNTDAPHLGQGPAKPRFTRCWTAPAPPCHAIPSKSVLTRPLANGCRGGDIKINFQTDWIEGCIGRYAPQQLPPTTTLLWQRRSYASSLRVQPHWHDTRREDYEQRQGVPAVRRRFARSSWVRTVGVVGGAGMAGLRIPPGCYQTDRPNCAASPS